MLGLSGSPSDGRTAHIQPARAGDAAASAAASTITVKYKDQTRPPHHRRDHPRGEPPTGTKSRTARTVSSANRLLAKLIRVLLAYDGSHGEAHTGGLTDRQALDPSPGAATRSVPLRGSGATGRPAAKASRPSTPDPTEPIHLVNQRRRIWIVADSNRKWLRECTVPIRTSYRQVAQSCLNSLQHSVIRVGQTSTGNPPYSIQSYCR